MHSWTGRSLIAFAAALLLAGCLQPPATPPSTAPSFRCTPEAGGAEFDCTQQQYDEMLAKDKLYAEAEAVYRRFVVEDARILRAGGITEASEALLETTHGEFLDNVMTNYRHLADRKIRATGVDPTMVFFRRASGRAKTGSVVSADICIDGRSLQFEESGNPIGNGRIALDATYFGRVEGALKIIGADGRQVEAC